MTKANIACFDCANCSYEMRQMADQLQTVVPLAQHLLYSALGKAFNIRRSYYVSSIISQWHASSVSDDSSEYDYDGTLTPWILGNPYNGIESIVCTIVNMLLESDLGSMLHQWKTAVFGFTSSDSDSSSDDTPLSLRHAQRWNTDTFSELTYADVEGVVCTIVKMRLTFHLTSLIHKWKVTSFSAVTSAALQSFTNNYRQTKVGSTRLPRYIQFLTSLDT